MHAWNPRQRSFDSMRAESSSGIPGGTRIHAFAHSLALYPSFQCRVCRLPRAAAPHSSTLAMAVPLMFLKSMGPTVVTGAQVSPEWAMPQKLHRTRVPTGAMIAGVLTGSIDSNGGGGPQARR